MTLGDLINAYAPAKEMDYRIEDLSGHYEYLSREAILAVESLASQPVHSFSFSRTFGDMCITLVNELY